MSKLHPLLLLICFLGCSCQNLEAQNSDKALKAAYIFNFAKYIQWPSDEPVFVIGVFGDNPEIVEVLETTLKGKKIGGKEIYVKKISSANNAITCHILYCPDVENKKLSAIIEAISGKSVLLVTEEDMIKKGAMISFIVEEDKLRFKLKKNALSQAKLVASEGLLKLAIVL
jgi:hypothetical protein